MTAPFCWAASFTPGVAVGVDVDTTRKIATMTGTNGLHLLDTATFSNIKVLGMGLALARGIGRLDSPALPQSTLLGVRLGGGRARQVALKDTAFRGLQRSFTER